jgi:DSBA-like thioredoxin domain-containing protein
MTVPALDFWFEFASTYSYPAAMRIDALARQAGVEVRFRPFLLGPIFKAQGWDTSPFNLFQAKGRHMLFSARRLSRRPTANCSGETTDLKLRSPGRPAGDDTHVAYGSSRSGNPAFAINLLASRTENSPKWKIDAASTALA